MRPRVTVIVPTYNRGSLVTRAIDSVLGQTYPNVDVLVVDDGSTDDTLERLRVYEPNQRFRLVRLDHNRGVTGAKNAGLDNLGKATAYAGILDSDDMLTPAAVEAIMRVFEANAGRFSQVFAWGVDMVSGEPTGLMPHREGPVTYDDALSGRFAGDFWHLFGQDLVGGRRFDERASGAESAIWWPLLKQRGAWLVPDVVLLVDTSGTDRISPVHYGQSLAIRRMWTCHAGLAAVADDMRDRYPRRYGDWLVELAKWSALAGERRRALKAAREGIRYAPSPRSLLMFGLVMLPRSLVRGLIGLRSSIRGASGSRRATPAS